MKNNLLTRGYLSRTLLDVRLHFLPNIEPPLLCWTRWTVGDWVERTVLHVTIVRSTSGHFQERGNGALLPWVTGSHTARLGLHLGLRSKSRSAWVTFPLIEIFIWIV